MKKKFQTVLTPLLRLCPSCGRFNDLAVFVFMPAALLFVYLKTLLPGVGYSGDTAKFQFLGKILGIPHPTGYPTYLILNHLFVTIFPFGELAYKANLLSALFTVMAVVVLLKILMLLEIDPFIAAVMAFSFGVTYTVWSQSVVAEVYTLNLLFVSLVVFFLLKWSIRRQNKYLLIACAIYSISFGNHMTMITFLPAIIYLVWKTNRTFFFNVKTMLTVASLAIIGASQYLYVFWRAYNPDILYLEFFPHNLKEVFWYLGGGWFKHSMFAFPFHSVMRVRIPMLVGFLNREFSLLLLLALIGYAVFPKKTLRMFLLLCWGGNVLFALNYDIADIFVFFMPSYLVVGIFIAQGVQWLSVKIPLKKKILKQALVLLIPASLLIVNYQLVDQSKNRQEAEHAQAILKTIERNAVIITSDYNRSEYFWYYLLGQGIQKERNIYVQNRFDIDEIKDYLIGNIPIFVRSQNMHLSTGLAVYVLDRQQKETLAKEGLTVIPIRDDLFRIEPLIPKKIGAD